MNKTLVILLFGLTACQTDETISGYTDNEAVWVLNQLQGTKVDTKVTLTFPEKGKAAGTAPCNSYFATQSAPLPWFELGPIAATKRACPDLALEQQYFAVLGRATLAEIQGDTLILSNDDGVLLSFKQN